ncbi:MAG: TVP38/TMEM64 family protein [Candidatus Omnitrophica bacterium]|nr:TVP38/TMEM64 family protein [Candidatus Omnitrophota bacterium]
MTLGEEKRPTFRWILFWLAVAALIIVPFLFFGDRIESLTQNFIEKGPENRFFLGIFLGGSLALDVFLPVPSSLVSTACGHYLGFFTGLIVSLVGMILGCFAGYGTGISLGRKAADRFVGTHELERLEKGGERWGDWMVAVFRPIPVLAEASVVYAGMSRIPFVRFTLVSSLANLGVSLVYAGIGAYAANINSFLVAFLASVILPGMAIFFSRSGRRNGGG